jgi:hypothetical protein
MVKASLQAPSWVPKLSLALHMSRIIHPIRTPGSGLASVRANSLHGSTQQESGCVFPFLRRAHVHPLCRAGLAERPKGARANGQEEQRADNQRRRFWDRNPIAINSRAVGRTIF